MIREPMIGSPLGRYTLFARARRLTVAVAIAALPALCTSALAAPPTAPQAPETPWGDVLDVGPHAVGFAQETLSRAAADGSTRTLTLSVWYPAIPGTGRPATIGDLFDIVVDEEQLVETNGLPRSRGLAAAMTGDAGALSVDVAERALETPVFARFGARPAVGSFKLALWSSRHATVLAQAPLAETLASHGFVVATVWSSDPPLAFMWEDLPESDKLATIEAQTGDLQHVLAALRRRENVDATGTLVFAWSYGGQTAARLQERASGIAGVIGIDSGILPAQAEERLDLRVPLIWFLGSQAGGPSLEGAVGLSAPVVVIQLPTLPHGNFNALEGFLPGLLGAETAYTWALVGPIAIDGYAALVRMSVAAATVLTDADPLLIDLWERLSTAAGEVPLRLVHDGTGR